MSIRLFERASQKLFHLSPVHVTGRKLSPTTRARSRECSRQVEIMVDDGTLGSDDDDTNTQNEVEASSLGPVTAEALLYDTNLAVGGGCDPAGCTADNTRVRHTGYNRAGNAEQLQL